MKTYEKYKDSGVEWIGKVPEHWEVKRGDSIFVLSKNIAKQTGLNGQQVFHYSIPVIQETGTGTIEDGDTVDSDKFILEGNEILFSKLNPRKGTVVISKKHELLTIASTEFVILKPQKDDIKFLFYFLKSNGFQDSVCSVVQSATRSHQRANPVDIYKNKILLPPFPEQTAIARYLDHKTAEIDQLIVQKERLLALWEEEKTALINQAVTRGLDAGAKMKDSGVAWLGEVPEGWEVKRLKYVGEINPTKDFEYDAGTICTFLPMEKVSEDGEIDCSIKKTVSELLTGFTFFKKNDVIVAKITPCFENGKGAILEKLDTDFGFGSTEFHVIRPNNGVLGKFLYFLTKSEIFMNIGEAMMIGSAGQKRVPTDFIRNFPVGLPKLPEQVAIVRHIETQTARIQTQMDQTRKLIERLKEYRATLISEVVTGKVKIIQ